VTGPLPASSGPEREPGDSDLTRTYVSVLALEILVLLGLWLFSRYFS
jgi:hypothetical protein